MELVVKVVLFTLFTMIVFGVAKYLQMKHIVNENKLLERYVDSMKMFCEEIERKLEVTRKYRHDLVGYIQTLERLLEEFEQNEKILEYVNDQKMMYERCTVSEGCGDEFLDSILNLKREECQKSGIVFDAKVEKGDYSGMEPVDKVCLFINLLDNAIEATERLKTKENARIFLRVRTFAGKLHVYMENNIWEGEIFSFQTKKSDAENHGLGTVIINQVLEKYEGVREFKFDREDLRVKDEIILALKN